VIGFRSDFCGKLARMEQPKQTTTALGTRADRARNQLPNPAGPYFLRQLRDGLLRPVGSEELPGKNHQPLRSVVQSPVFLAVAVTIGAPAKNRIAVQWVKIMDGFR